MPAVLPWQEAGSVPWLALIQLLPLLAALSIYLLRGRAAIVIALSAASVELWLTVRVAQLYQPGQSAMQFAEHQSLLGGWGYWAAIDGISIVFMLLTALLTLMVIVYAPLRQLTPYARLMPPVLLVEASTMSLFCTLDLLWFVLLSAVQLLAIGYLLWGWATSASQRDRMLTRFMQFMLVGILLLLAGTIALGWHYSDSTGDRWHFDLLALSQFPVSPALQSVLFFLLFYGLAVRIPLFPLHGWLPSAAEHGNIAVAPIFLVGLKTGIYGLTRFVFPILPEAVTAWSSYVAAFAMAGIFYAALLATIQNNIRRLLAFATVSHTSFLIIGLFTLELQAFQGATLAAINLGLAVSALLLMSGLVFRRTDTMQLNQLGGLFDAVPMLGLVFLIAGLSIVGMPGTPGFDALHLLIEASIQRFGALLTIAAALGNVTAAGFLLWAFQRAFLGPAPMGSDTPVASLDLSEWLICLVLIMVLLAAGFYASPWLTLLETPALLLEQVFDTAATQTRVGR